MNEEIIESQGWKGKAKNEIVETQHNYIILRCWKKHKESGEVYYTDHKVSKKAIDNLLDILNNHCEPRNEYGTKFMWRHIVELYDIHNIENLDKEVVISLFNGGKFRSKYYFPFYYFPMKILEEKGEIWYGEKTWMWLGSKEVELQ